MSTSAIVVMVIGMLLIWGGLAASIVAALRAGRRARQAPEVPGDG